MKTSTISLRLTDEELALVSQAHQLLEIDVELSINRHQALKYLLKTGLSTYLSQKGVQLDHNK